MRRILMRRSLADRAPDVPPAPEGVTFRHPSADDAEALAILMFEAYRGTIDAEPTDTLDTARGEVATTLEGGYGDLMPEASFLAEDGGRLVSASLLTRWRDHPLIAFTMTTPDRKGRGLSRAALVRSLAALAQAGEDHVDLAVTDGNEPAQHLYKTFGFVEVESG
ncbi:MAG: N-acetyltransferase family protein [Actinomycetota bacterium]